MKRFGKSCETIFTPKEWFLSNIGQKEGEIVARGHFYERVGETPVHWLPPGVGSTQNPFSVSENGRFENLLRSNSISTCEGVLSKFLCENHISAMVSSKTFFSHPDIVQFKYSVILFFEGHHWPPPEVKKSKMPLCWLFSRIPF